MLRVFPECVLYMVMASGDLRSFPGDPEQCQECGSWLELGVLVLFSSVVVVYCVWIGSG